MSEATAGRLSGGGRLCWGAGESPESIFTRRPRRSCWLWAGAVAPSQGCSKWPGPQPCTVALGRSTSYTAAAGCNTVSQRAGGSRGAFLRQPSEVARHPFCRGPRLEGGAEASPASQEKRSSPAHDGGNATEFAEMFQDCPGGN